MYRRSRNQNADVDETLFGNTGVPRGFLASKEHDKARGTIKAPGRSAAKPAVPQFGRRASPAPKAEAIVMSAYDLASIKARSIIVSDEDRAAAAAEAAYQHEQKHAVAQQRKDKMLRMEAERRAKTGPSEEQQEKINQQMAARTNAAKMMDEQADDVKRMNQMSNYAKTVTIRDRQIADKLMALEAEKIASQNMDMMMERQRLADIEADEKQQQERLERNRAGAEVIIDQMASNEAKRVRDLELLQLERERMRRDIELAKEKEAAAALAKKEESTRRMQEVQKANERMRGLKKQQAELERLEDLRIAQYVQEQDNKKELEEQMARKRAEEKEKETARLRALQEKASNKAAEEDAKKARRAQEAYDRECRLADLASAEAAIRKKSELNIALKHQMQEKRASLELAAREERREFEHILKTQQEAEIIEQAKRAAKAEQCQANQTIVKNQIAHNATERESLRLSHLQEGETMRKAMETQSKKSNFIKAQKLKELEGLGIPEKYRSELAKTKVGM